MPFRRQSVRARCEGARAIVNDYAGTAPVAAEVVEHGRGPKIIAFKKRRRKNSRRKRGYREEFTLIRITEILTDGHKPSKEARPKPARKEPPAPAAHADAPAQPALPAACQRARGRGGGGG